MRPYTLYEGLVYYSGGRAKSGKKGGRPRPLSDTHYGTVASAHEDLLNDQTRLEWLADERGLELATAEQYQLGYRGAYTVPVFSDQILVNVRRYTPAVEARPGGPPKWMGMAGVKRLIYPDPLRMKHESWILWCEGELDALLARQHGLPAFTQTGGATSGLRSGWEPHFAGKNVAVAYDCDAAGAAGSLVVARQMVSWGCTVRIVALGLGPAEDVSDFLHSYGHSAADLRDLVGETPKFEEPHR